MREAERRGIRPEYVLFDSWYAAANLLHLLEGFGWKYVARLKSNRLFEGRAVRQRWRHRFGRAVGRLRKVNHEVVVVKDGRRYFVTNAVQLSASQLKRHYRLRQQIEEVFRLLKQEFGWGGASAQRARAQVAHLHLGLYALCITEQAAIKEGQTIYAFKRELFRLPIPASSIETVAAERGAQVIWLAPYSPDFSPIELMWSKIKTVLRAAKARTREELEQALIAALKLVTADDCAGWFSHCGYQVASNCKSL